MKKYGANGVKPRFDGKGSEFGLIHRDLGPGFLMFDLDRLSANVELSLELRREDEAFVEYRHAAGAIHFIALFEVKKHRTGDSERAIDSRESSSMARNEIARRLGCRLFVVFGTNGSRPFVFWEWNANTDEYEFVGVLDYEPGQSERAIKNFWRDVLGIERYCTSRQAQTVA